MRVVPLILCLVGWVAFARGELVPATQPATIGPDVIVLNELEKLYQPVPFDHRAHAQMADMWDGCETCHHRKPIKRSGNSTTPVEPQRSQAAAAQIPQCKSCHEVTEEAASINMPNLKGAYHRQCLNCHKEWMHDNACVICHKPKDPRLIVASTSPAPTVDDITGRMHPPIPEPAMKLYKARFTPAVGSNVLFRHRDHTERYGLKCAGCHRRDNCSDCHDGRTHIATPPVRPGRTWKDSHSPCVSCHQSDRCGHCHYKDGDPAPLPFDHRTTGQALDKDHAKLKCGECHSLLRSTQKLSCGPSACHERPSISFPKDKPGPMLAKPIVAMQPQPVTRPSVQATTRQAQLHKGGRK